MKFKKLLLAMACCLSISSVYAADTIAITESSADKLLTIKEKDPDTGETFTDYNVSATGSYTVTAKISGMTFYEAGITLEELNKDTTVGITMGDFSFNSTLGETDKPALSKTKLAATWTQKEDVCDANDKCKSVITEKVSITSGGSAITLKVTGSNGNNGDSSYGQSLFLNACTDNGSGVLDAAAATLTVNDKPISADLKVTCSVKSKTVTKPDDDYTLNTIKITGKKL